MDLIILLCSFLVICVEWYKEQTISLISYNKLCGLLPAFTSARAIGNLWSNCLGVSVLSPVPLVALFFDSDAIKEQSSYNVITSFLAL